MRICASLPAGAGAAVGLAARAAALAAALLAPPAPALAAEAPANLVANGDFSQVAAGRPDAWEAAGDARSVTQVLRAARDADGRPCAELACTRFEHQGPASHAMIAQVGRVALARGRLYEFSCRLRSPDIRGRAVSVAISDTATWTNCGLQDSLPVGRQWRTVRRVFTAARDVGPTSRLQFWYAETGTLCLADVRIVECAAQAVEFTDVVPPGGGRNLVRNASFEVGACGWSSLGRRVGWGALQRLYGRVCVGGAPHGESYLRVPVDGRETPTLYFDYYEPVVHRETRPLAAGVGWIPLEPGAAYTLSCHLRAGDDGVRAVFGVRAKDPSGRWQDYRQTVDLAREWRRHALTFRPAHRYGFVFVGGAMDRVREAYVDLDAVQLEKGEQATPFEPRTALEFALEPSAPAGLFTPSDSPALVLHACNHGPAPARAAVRFQAADFSDRPASLAEQSLEVAPGASVRRRVDLPADWRGFYRVRATAEAAGRAEPADLRLAIVPPRGTSDSVLGINHAFATEDLILLAAKAGVGWYRDWSLKWQHVEPARGEFHWERADEQIHRVRGRGVRLMALLPPFPSADWISEAPDGLPATGYPGVRLRQAWAPRDPAELARFVGQAVARYRAHIQVWEFLNEPIYTDYALPADPANRYGGRQYAPRDYVALLAVASAAMKRADPACRVMGGIGSGPAHLTREVLEAGALKHLDLFNLHFYPGSRRPEGTLDEMQALLALMDRHGGRRPIWVTEFAYYAADDLPRRPFIASPNSWSEARLLESERQGADYTARFLLAMLARGVEKVFLHSGASGGVNEPDFECALFAYGGAPRKALAALAVLADLLGPAPKFLGERRLGESAYAFAFEGPGRGVVALWDADEDAATRMTAPETPGLRRLDAMGRDLAPGPIPLSPSPVYLVVPPAAGPEALQAVQPAAPPR